MARFSEADKKRLLSNQYVEKISSTHVTFSAKFKVKAVKERLEGKTPIQIFTEAGLDVGLFLPDLPKKSIDRWKKVYLKEGSEGFEVEKRGQGSKGRPKKSYDLNDLDSVLDRLAYLEVENEFLKKLHALAAESQKKKSTR